MSDREFSGRLIINLARFYNATKRILTKKEGGVDDFTKSLVGCGDDVGKQIEQAFGFATFGGSEGESMALSWGGEECCV